MRGRIRKQTHVDGRISWGFEIPYRDAVTNARRTFTRRRFPTKRAAEEALAEAVVRYQQGEPIAIDRTVTVGRLLAEWLVAIEPSVSPGTIKARRNNGVRAKRRCGTGRRPTCGRWTSRSSTGPCGPRA